MRVAAFTMIYEGYDLLHRWIRHYSTQLGAENLYVVSHGDDPRHREIASNSNVIGIPRLSDRKEGFNRTRHNALHGLMNFLNGYYDATIRVDADELVFVDPDMHSSIGECLSKTDCDAWFALGMNLYRTREGPIDPDAPISKYAPRCVMSHHYSKAVAGRRGMVIGFHGARDIKRGNAMRMAMPKGLYLAHLGTFEGLSRTPFSTKKASRMLEKNIVVEDLPVVDADVEFADAYEAMSTGFGKFRPTRPNTFIVPRRKCSCAFVLPERMVGLF